MSYSKCLTFLRHSRLTESALICVGIVGSFILSAGYLRLALSPERNPFTDIWAAFSPMASLLQDIVLHATH